MTALEHLNLLEELGDPHLVRGALLRKDPLQIRPGTNGQLLEREGVLELAVVAQLMEFSVP
ncbi:hypothetical protein HRbin07_00651 [bacterium HR07]|nr:hypothetical protein HRbin07_00651 [bacterium HR07]